MKHMKLTVSHFTNEKKIYRERHNNHATSYKLTGKNTLWLRQCLCT